MSGAISWPELYGSGLIHVRGIYRRRDLSHAAGCGLGRCNSRARPMSSRRASRHFHVQVLAGIGLRQLRRVARAWAHGRAAHDG